MKNVLFAVIPELSAIIGEAGANLQASDEAGIQTCLRQCFKALMTCPAEIVKSQLASLVERHSSLGMHISIFFSFSVLD